MMARATSVALGLWLMVSGALWPHVGAQRINATVVGASLAIAAMTAVGGERRWRQIRSAIGAWLVVSSIGFGETSTATFWNHALVGLALLASQNGGRGYDRRIFARRS
jgi:hypothetical protein